MTGLKNAVAFSVAAAIFFMVAAGALFIIKSGTDTQSEIFRIIGDEEFVFFGQKITINQNVIDGINTYLYYCRRFSDLIFPDCFKTPVKNAAELYGSAVAGIIYDLYTIAYNFVYGNM